MKYWITVVMLVLAGCAGIPQPDTSSWLPTTRDPAKGQFWDPTSEEQSRAEQLGRRFAYEKLGLSASDILKMRSDFIGWFENGKTILHVQFYDPAYHQPLPDGGFEGMMGGFPTYFSVSVDVEEWEVVDYYADEE